MTTILEQAARASLASRRRSAAKARLHGAVSIDTGEFPAVSKLASTARVHRKHVVEVTQDLGTLQAAYSRDSK